MEIEGGNKEFIRVAEEKEAATYNASWTQLTPIGVAPTTFLITAIDVDPIKANFAAQ